MNWKTSEASLEITRQNLKSCLVEWGDAEYQTALWTSNNLEWVHVPVEAACDFHDSAVMEYFEPLIAPLEKDRSLAADVETILEQFDHPAFVDLSR